MRSSRLAPIGWALGCAAVAALASAANTAPAARSSARGRQLFEDRGCRGCHSLAGKGGTAGPALDHAGDDHDAAWHLKHLKDPQATSPGSIMPPATGSADDLAALVAFVMTLKSPAAPPVPPPGARKQPPVASPSEGKGRSPMPATPSPAAPTSSRAPAASSKPPPSAPPAGAPAPPSSSPHPALSESARLGRDLFTAKGCNGCHAIDGQGGSAGPALDGVGARRGSRYLNDQIRDPKIHNPNSAMPAVPMRAGERQHLVDYLLTLTGGRPATQVAVPVATGAPKWVGSAACRNCHASIADSFAHTVHGQVLLTDALPGDLKGCESCHGPGSLHAAAPTTPGRIVDPASLKPAREAKLCLSCHHPQVNVPEWLSSAHAAAGLSCSACHALMQPKAPGLLKQSADQMCLTCHADVRAQFAANTHHPVPEGRMHCVDCHNPHSGLHDAMLVKEGDALCVTCHAEKQGPFVFEHPAINGGFTQGCLACHMAHGSPHRALRRFAGRGLCVQCHTDLAATHFPTYAECDTAGCHVAIHGSNSSSLFFTG